MPSLEKIHWVEKVTTKFKGMKLTCCNRSKAHLGAISVDVEFLRDASVSEPQVVRVRKEIDLRPDADFSFELSYVDLRLEKRFPNIKILNAVIQEVTGLLPIRN